MRVRRAKVKLAAARWHNRKMSAAFLSWLDDVQRKKRNREAVKRSVGRMMHRKLHAAFAGWRAKVEAKVHARKEMARVLKMIVTSKYYSRRGNRRLVPPSTLPGCLAQC